jgi:hypothetical protein
MPKAQSKPGLGSAFRAAASDIYYQSIRLVPANLIWGAGFVAVLAIAAWLSPNLALVVTPLLAVPYAGIVRLATQIVRGEDVVLSDFATAVRAYAVPAVAAGAVIELASVVFASNLVSGVAEGSPAALAFATLAAWGLAAAWILGLAFWPLLVDPARATPPGDRARLVAFVVLAQPGRFAIMGIALAAVALVSAVAFPALLSVSVAFIALVSARVVLPAADRLEARTVAREPAPGATDPA